MENQQQRSSNKKINQRIKPTTSPLKVHYKADGSYFNIYISPNDIYQVHYPMKFLAKMLPEDKMTLLNNYVYCKTSPLKISHQKLKYNFQKPLLNFFIDKSVTKDIPRIAHMSNVNTRELELNFKNNISEFIKTDGLKKIDLKRKQLKDKFILSLSFGKDSLLTYALLKDLGTKFSLVSFDIGIKNEKKVKHKIIKNFQKAEKQSITVVKDNTDKLLTDKKPEKKLAYLDYTNGLLSFAFELLPIALHKESKYIVFGNQKDFDSYFLDEKSHQRVYYSFDQTTTYMKMQNEAFGEFTNNNIQVTSLIKPIYTLMIYKLFVTRYKRLLPYILSCEESKTRQWCGKCDVCTEAYLFTSAFADPKILKFKEATFAKKFAKKYMLFSKVKKSFQNVYPPCQREQELLAFLYAQRNGQKGYLIDQFAKRFKKEALRKEKILRNKFFKIYRSELIPGFLRNSLYSLLDSGIQPK